VTQNQTFNPTINVTVVKRPTPSADNVVAATSPSSVSTLSSVRATDVSLVSPASQKPAAAHTLQQALFAGRQEARTVSGKIKAMNKLSDWNWHDKMVSR
jgi:hypothetical protein